MTNEQPDGPPSAGHRGRLDQEAIVLAAVALIDAEGLQQLSMRRLGSALGVEGMALYRYFPKRNALLDAVVERLAITPATDPAAQLADNDDWGDWLTRLAHGVRAMALTHPRVFPLIATHPPQAPWLRPPLRSLTWVDAFLAGLGDHHFPPDAAATVYKMFSSFLLGHLLLEVSSLGLEQPGRAAPTTPGDVDREVADRARRADTAQALHAMAGDGPTEHDILGAADGRSTALDHEVAIVAATPAADRSSPAAVDDTAADPQDARPADLDAPLVTAAQDDVDPDLAAHPHVAALVAELSADTAERDFDRHLGHLLQAVAGLRRD